MKVLFDILLNQYRTALISLALLEMIRAILIVCNSFLFADSIVNLYVNQFLLPCLCCSIIFKFIINKRLCRLSLNFQSSLRRRVHNLLFSDSFKFSSGQLLSLCFDNVRAVDDFFTVVLPNIISIAFLIPVILITAAFLDPITAMLFFITLPVAPIILYLIGNVLAQKTQLAQSSQLLLNSVMKELLTAITTVKIFKRQKAALDKLIASSESSAELTLNVLKLAFVSSFALEIITTLSIAVIAVSIGLRLIVDDIDFESALMLLLLAPQFYSPIRMLGSSFHSVVNAERVINSECVIRNSELGVRYNSKLCNKDWEKKGLTVIVGQSGSGKTTLMRNYECVMRNESSGVKLFKNQENESNRNLESTIKNEGIATAYMPQFPHLFNVSVRDNLSLFKTVDDSILSQALFEVALDFSLDDVITSMSRGQLQRFALARVLVQLHCSSLRFVLLDEPTASLDDVTRQLVISKILNISEYCRVIVATHDIGIISKAQQIIDLDNLTRS